MDSLLGCLGVIVVLAIGSCIGAVIFMLLWNLIICNIFALPHLGFLQAWVISFILGIFFGR
jgi:uncharacterized membrane protein